MKPGKEIKEIFAERDFVVRAELCSEGSVGVYPLLDKDECVLGDLAGLTRIHSRFEELWPESFVDQGNGSYFRVSNDGVEYGTSIVGSAGFRTVAQAHLMPEPKCMRVSGEKNRFSFCADGDYREEGRLLASTRSKRIWQLPEGGRGPVQVDLSAVLEIKERIALSNAADLAGKDRFRWFMMSSMYVNDMTYDGNLLRFNDADDKVREISFSDFFHVNNKKRRSGHLFEKPVPLGSWIELVKTAGSSWLPRSPTMRYDLRNTGGMKLGVQGWWSGSSNPHDDNLNIWLEWIDVPDVLEVGVHLQLDVAVSSLPCRGHKVAVSRPSWPKRLWWRPKDYSHEML